MKLAFQTPIKLRNHISNGEKYLVIWSKSGVQNNDWRLAVYKAITNEVKSISDIARQILSKHGLTGWDGTLKRKK